MNWEGAKDEEKEREKQREEVQQQKHLMMVGLRGCVFHEPRVVKK